MADKKDSHPEPDQQRDVAAELARRRERLRRWPLFRGKQRRAPPYDQLPLAVGRRDFEAYGNETWLLGIVNMARSSGNRCGPDDPLVIPRWVLDAIVPILSRDLKRPRRKGPNASPTKQREKDRVDYFRYLAVHYFNFHGHPLREANHSDGAFALASMRLAEIGDHVSASGVETSYRRVKKILEGGPGRLTCSWHDDVVQSLTDWLSGEARPKV